MPGHRREAPPGRPRRRGAAVGRTGPPRARGNGDPARNGTASGPVGRRSTAAAGPVAPVLPPGDRGAAHEAAPRRLRRVPRPAPRRDGDPVNAPARQRGPPPAPAGADDVDQPETRSGGRTRQPTTRGGRLIPLTRDRDPPGGMLLKNRGSNASENRQRATMMAGLRPVGPRTLDPYAITSRGRAARMRLEHAQGRSVLRPCGPKGCHRPPRGGAGRAGVPVTRTPGTWEDRGGIPGVPARGVSDNARSCNLRA